MSLDEALTVLKRAALCDRVALVMYDNPDTVGDERARFIQPTYVVQTKSNLLCAAWQYAPASDWRLFRLRHFVQIFITPYDGLFRTSHTFDLDSTISFAEYQHCCDRIPYDRRSSRRRDIEVFYFEALAAIRHRAFAGGPIRYPACPHAMPTRQ